MTTAAKSLEIAKNERKIYEAGKAEAEAITRGIIDGTITELVVPDGVTQIRGYAFSYCLAMKKITIPEGVARISGNGLSTTGLTELDLPMSCEILDAWCLYNNQYLTRIRFGDVKTIGTSALRGAKVCTEYDFSRCSTVPTLADMDALGSINANAKILVPAALYYEWIAATNWSEYADHIVPDGELPTGLIEFYFCDAYGAVHTLQAVEGMTWQEWCDSEYNTVELYITDWGELYSGVSGVSGQNADDIIIANTTYVIA